ncbi:low molecular weight neuronal intermediate filament [Morone saxatilis]|uniref:low molecular weight neuronal intermediate filament n=1 Tax=Morone saxatilis TaxID=34816 RepID=UPI0015E236FA|nr:low molecular weight neuronal intermediate filament [Morone saxatilis]
MAMLRVSSYRKLFEDENWSRNGGLSMQCAGQSRASVRGAAVDKCDCDKLDFVAAKALNKEGLNRFVQDRTIIATLNDRLVKLIELAHCFEEENESLECQIVELQEELNSRQTSSGISSAVAERVTDYSLDAVVERLRRERDEILCDSEELQKELERLMKEYEKAAQQRILFQQERQDVAEDVDAVTAACLALREQVAIYEEQLANMDVQQKTAVESLLEPAEWTTGEVAAIKFGSPDITAALNVKEYYWQLAESLQYECGAGSSAVVRSGDGKQLEVGGAVGSTVKDLPKTKDIGEMKTLISELQKELAELEKCNEELEDEVEMKKAAYVDEIAELECTIDEMRHQEADFQVQMKEQCEDYKELLSEKMARDMEITAYRSLVEGEEERLCNL